MFDWEVNSQVQFRMWIDPGQDVVYGFYLSFNESTGDTRDFPENERYQAYARSMGFGIIGTQFSDRENDNDINHSDTVIDALEAFAEMSGHPEVANAPVITEGLSLGGHNSIKFAAIHPERTIGYIGGGISYLPEEVSNPAFASVPGFFYQGSEDTDPDEHLADFLGLRSDSIEVAYFTQWDFGHDRGNAVDIGWKFLADAVYLRYPIDQSPLDGPVDLIDIPTEDGWTADPDTWDEPMTAIAPYAEAASPDDDFWLPTRDMAYVYRAHATRERPVAFVSPTDADNLQWTTVDPGEAVDVEISVGSLGNVQMVELFDGSESIVQMTSAPYVTTWAAEGVGAHELVAVATLGDGTRRTGYVAPVLVRGTIAHPGGGQPSPGGSAGDDGGDDGGTDDGGAEDGGGDGTGATDGGSDGKSGGGCSANGATSDGSAPLFAVLALAGLVLRRRRGWSS